MDWITILIIYLLLGLITGEIYLATKNKRKEKHEGVAYLVAVILGPILLPLVIMYAMIKK